MTVRLPNKLRLYTGVLGGVLTLVSIWGAFRYEAPVGGFLLAALVGSLVVISPYVVAYAKLLHERRRQTQLGESIFASPQLDVERETFLDRSTTVLDSVDAFVEVKRRGFPEGAGLVVDHTRFHGTFVRLTETGRVVVTGIKNEAARAVVDVMEDAWSSPFSRQESNPFLRPIPVRGLSRSALTLALTVVVLFDAAFVVGLAYPNPAYNTGERTILVGVDVRAGIDPGMDDADAKLSKAAFLVRVLEEEATEIRWQAGINNSSRESVNDAPAISSDITSLLDAAGESDLSPDQRARLAHLRTAHQQALADVETALAEPQATTTPPEFDSPWDILQTENTTTTTAA